MIDFHRPYKLDNSIEYIQTALDEQTAGDGRFGKRCELEIKKALKTKYVLMTTSGTHALELACQSIDLSVDDEVILPSYTYPSTANAVLLTGATIVYTEIDKDTLMMDANYIEEKITEKTKAIIPVHYGGMICDMPKIMDIATRYGLLVIEDAAQGFLAKGPMDKFGGTYGHIGCFSFHGTKDIVAGEGGAIVFQDSTMYKKAGKYRQKGTNAEEFHDGNVVQYEWVSQGSSYSPSELNMALLYSQLLQAQTIVEKRQFIAKIYYEALDKLKYKWNELGIINVGQYNEQLEINGHIFYLVFNNELNMRRIQDRLSSLSIDSRTHFVPLHESEMGKKFIREINHFEHENGLSRRLLRLPIYPDLTLKDVMYIIKGIEG